jgi:two-component system response regulator MprA
VSPASLLLLVDPEAPSSAHLYKHLQALGHHLRRCCDQESFSDVVHRHSIDLALLVDELGTFPLNDLCLALRAVHPFVPILVLFRFDSYGDRVKLLRAGADDVLSAPYALEELLARVEALLRRSAFNLHASDSDPAVLRHRDLSVHTDQRTVQRGGKPIKLTVKEYDLLLHLLKHHGVVQPRLDILKAVWGHTWVGNDNLLDVYIRYLRKKIERPDLDPLIHTVRGVGFMLD